MDDKTITHDEAEINLDLMADGSIGRSHTILSTYIRQQRARDGVRVVKILDENNADEVSSKEEYWHDLPPHTALAIIERRAGAAAGEEKP